jgi:diguanylate cyclase (GGDEF)-like protein
VSDPAPAGADSRLEEEVRALREEIERLHAEASRNEAVFRRTLERELAVLDAQSLPDLLSVVVDGMRESYRLESVTLVVQDPQHEVRHMLLGDGRPPGGFAGVVFTDSLLALAPQMHSLVRPWLGPYASADHQLLLPGVSGLASVAILPLRRGGQLVGALNFGSADPARFSRSLASDFLGHLAMIVGFALDSACNRTRLLRAGVTDYLTGWHNKRYLHARLREEIARSQRHGTPLALLMLDLDNFKEVNDRHGHLSGDAAIREVASRIDSQVRDSDAAARFGGDEFVVLLPGAGAAQATQAAQRIMRAVSAAPVDLAPGAGRTLTLSVGIAVYVPAASAGASPAEGEFRSRAEQLLAEADAALYRAKAAGRNQLALAD